jgi:hypothetical protein
MTLLSSNAFLQMVFMLVITKLNDKKNASARIQFTTERH